MAFECDKCGYEGVPLRNDVLIYPQYDDEGNLTGEPAYCHLCAEELGLR